ncbi:hypothetical protein RugamoR57_07410 [Duganella caerulea]
MPRLPMLLGLIFVSLAAQAEEGALAELTKGQPKAVASVVERIAMCTHFAGEEPYDAARGREIAAAMKKYRCDKLDKDEAALRKRYQGNAAVLGVLQKAHEW